MTALEIGLSITCFVLLLVVRQNSVLRRKREKVLCHKESKLAMQGVHIDNLRRKNSGLVEENRKLREEFVKQGFKLRSVS